MMLTLDQAQPLIDWINEREAIRIRKAILEHGGAGAAEKMRVTPAMQQAWGITKYGPGGMGWRLDYLTHDPILREHRFCNMRREDDRVTRWIRENIREPFADHEHLWFMLAIARYVNWPPAIAELLSGCEYACWPSDPSFEPWRMTRVLEARRARGEKVETAAFMIRAESDKNAPWYSWSKQRYVCEVVLGKLWARREEWRVLLGLDSSEYPNCDRSQCEFCQDDPGCHNQQTLEGVWNKFQDPYYTGWGPFMAYQVVIDMRWTRYLRDAPDIQTWAALGPGSRRGLNRLHGRPVDFPLKQEQGCAEMIELRELLKTPGALAPWVELPDLSDVQNCLCETDKYLRVKNGEGRPRAKYVPGRGY